MRLLLALILAFASIVRAQAPIHVDSASPVVGDGTVGRPFRSLDDVVPLLSAAYDVVLIRRGSVFQTPNTFDIPSNTVITTYGSGPKPVIDMGGAESSIGVRTQNVSNVLIEDLVVRRANRGFHHLGSAFHVRLLRCEAIEIFANDGFTHTDEPSPLTASGSIVYEKCRAHRCDGDGFNNAGVARDVALACEATYCGPKWGDYETPEALPRARIVWVDSESGDDANDGLSQATAVATLVGANAVSRPGDEVRLTRGSLFTGPYLARRDQHVRAWGKGPRPRIDAGPTSAAVVVSGARGVRLEGLHLTGSRGGIVAVGDVDGLEVVDCNLVDNGFGMLAAGAGVVAVYESRVERNELGGLKLRGEVTLLCVDAAVNGHDRRPRSCGLDVDEGARAIVVGGVYRGNAIGVRLAGDGPASMIVGALVSESTRDDFGVGIHVVRGAGSANPTIVNTVVGVPDPLGASEHHGVLAETDVNLLNCTFYNSNSGAAGRVSRSVTLGDGADESIITNCVFDDAGVAEARFIEVGAGIGTAIGNWYHAPTVTEGKWVVRGSLLAWHQWRDRPGVEDALVGGVTAAPMVRGDPARFVWNASLAGPAGRSPGDGGVDLTVVFSALGLPGEDLGRRPRGIDGSWGAGALEQRTFSADGFTTHDASAFRIVSCTITACGDGVHFTHLNPSGDETAVIDCEFRDILEVGLNGAINQNWETRDCRFYSCERGAGGIRPAIGETQVFDSCLFVDCREAAIHADPVFPARIRLQNCIIVLPEAIDRDEGFGVNIAAGPVDLDVFNSTITMAGLDTEDSPSYGIRCTEGSLALYNCVFDGARAGNAYYVSVPTRGQVLADHNFYELESIVAERWLCEGPRHFFSWQWLQRGCNGSPTDFSGGFQPRSLIGARGDARPLASGDYFIAPASSAYGHGLSVIPLFSRAWESSPRAAFGAWNTGPSALDSVAKTIRRDLPGRTTFNRFEFGPAGATDVRIAPRSVEATGETIEINRIAFTAGPGITAVIHEGPYPGSRVLWTGSLATPVAVSVFLQGLAYEDLFVSFVGGPGVVSGEVGHVIR